MYLIDSRTISSPPVISTSSLAQRGQTASTSAVSATAPQLRQDSVAGYRDEIDDGAGRLSAFGDHAEGLCEGFGVDRMPDTDADPDPGYLPPRGALADRRQHAFAQAVLMHVAP